MPTAKDVIIQKLRWAKPKDLDDARGVPATQGRRLDGAYLKGWANATARGGGWTSFVARIQQSSRRHVLLSSIAASWSSKWKAAR